MLHTRNVAKAQNYRVRFFSTKQLHLLILCTFSRFGESGFGESGLNRSMVDHSHVSTPAKTAYHPSSWCRFAGSGLLVNITSTSGDMSKRHNIRLQINSLFRLFGQKWQKSVVKITKRDAKRWCHLVAHRKHFTRLHKYKLSPIQRP